MRLLKTIGGEASLIVFFPRLWNMEWRAIMVSQVSEKTNNSTSSSSPRSNMLTCDLAAAHEKGGSVTGERSG